MTLFDIALGLGMVVAVVWLGRMIVALQELREDEKRLPPSGPPTISTYPRPDPKPKRWWQR